MICVGEVRRKKHMRNNGVITIWHLIKYGEAAYLLIRFRRGYYLIMWLIGLLWFKKSPKILPAKGLHLPGSSRQLYSRMGRRTCFKGNGFSELLQKEIRKHRGNHHLSQVFCLQQHFQLYLFFYITELKSTWNSHCSSHR